MYNIIYLNVTSKLKNLIQRVAIFQQPRLLFFIRAYKNVKLKLKIIGLRQRVSKIRYKEF